MMRWEIAKIDQRVITSRYSPDGMQVRYKAKVEVQRKISTSSR